MLQVLRVLLDLGRARARGDDDRLGAGFDLRPPRVDVPAHHRVRGITRAEVVARRPAASGGRHRDVADAQPVEDTRRGGVDARRDRALHAAAERQHPPPVPCRGPGARRLARRHLACENPGKQRTHQAARREQRRESRAMRDDREQGLALDALGERSGNAFLHKLAPDVSEPAVAHSGRAGRLARAAGEAAIEMELGAGGDLRAFQELLDEIDPPARTVELVAEDLVGRTGRGAEAAVHALAQDGVRGASVGGIADEVGEAGLHSELLMRMDAAASAGARSARRARPGPAPGRGTRGRGGCRQPDVRALRSPRTSVRD